ncbi:MAG: flagellar basal body L-ring protein FlgH [Fimbriimonadaceae bacterium]|nr:flagellar basal body L-ring protein FlgH [Fimbriimonadaceae bacterium]
MTTTLFLLALLQSDPAAAAPAVAAAPATTAAPARPLAPPQTGAGRSAGRPTAAGEPGSATPTTAASDHTVAAPLDRPRYAAPVGPPPQVGYAPQAGAPLPGYPGLSPAAAGSSGYPARTSGSGPLVSLFTDLKASGVGDVITIVITQQAVAASNGKSESSKDASASFDGGAGIFQLLPSLGLKYDGKTGGEASTNSTFSVATTFTATVTEVLPNGNLKVEGQQIVNLGGKDQWTKLSGEVRPYDVRADNSIDSTKVANVRIEFVGVRDRGKRKGLFDVLGNALESLFGWLF